jgi:hypothetical protein
LLDLLPETPFQFITQTMVIERHVDLMALRFQFIFNFRVNSSSTLLCEKNHCSGQENRVRLGSMSMAFEIDCAAQELIASKPNDPTGVLSRKLMGNEYRRGDGACAF